MSLQELSDEELMAIAVVKPKQQNVDLDNISDEELMAIANSQPKEQTQTGKLDIDTNRMNPVLQGKVEKKIIGYNGKTGDPIYESNEPFIHEGVLPVAGEALGSRFGAVGTGIGGFLGDLADQAQLNIAGKQKGFDFGRSAIAGTIGGVTHGAMPFINKLAKNAYSKAGQFLAGIPKDAMERALNQEIAGNSIFKGKWNPVGKFEELGDKAYKGIEFLKNQAGNAVNLENKALSNIDYINIPTTELSQQADSILNRFSSGGRINPVMETAGRDVDKIYEMIGKGADNQGNLRPRDLHDIKKSIYAMSNYYTDKSDIADNALKSIASEYNDTLGMLSPQYRNINQEYSDLMDLVQYLGAKGNDKNIASTIKNAKTDSSQLRGITDTLTDINNNLPQNYQFLDGLDDTIARREFETFMPGRGGGSGSGQGYANIIRASTIGTGLGGSGIAGLFTGNPIPFVTSLAASASVAPKTYKYGIKLGVPAAKTISKSAPSAATLLYLQNAKKKDKKGK